MDKRKFIASSEIFSDFTVEISLYRVSTIQDVIDLFKERLIEVLEEHNFTSLIQVLENKKLHIHTPSRTMTIKWKNLELYLGDRARRGQLLPKGWRKVDRLSTEID